jgi:hypothetical protein
MFPFLFAKEAAATTSTYVLQVPTLQSDKNGSLGTIYISEAAYPMSLRDGDSFSINLPPCIELQKIRIQETGFVNKTASILLDKDNRQFTVNGSVYDYGDFTSPIKSIDGKYGFLVQVTDNNRFNVKVQRDPSVTSSSGFKFYLLFDQVYVRPLGPDDPTAITATLDAPSGSGFSTGSYTVANIALGGTTAVVDAPLSTGTDQKPIVPVLGESGGRVAAIIIKESAPGSLKAGNGDVKLALSPGFTWKSVSVVADWGYGVTNEVSDVNFTVDNGTDPGGRSLVRLTINKATVDKPGRITVTGTVDVDTTVAQPGDVQVSYEGTNPGVDAALLTVAQYAASAKTAAQKTITDVTAGRIDQRIGQFAVEEGAPGDLAAGRTIIFTLPSYARWRTPPLVYKEKGDGVLEFLDLNQDKDKVRYKVTKASTVKSVFVFKYGSVDLALGAPDNLSITVSGSAGVTGTVDIGNVMLPVTLQADKGTVRAGLLGQAVSDISITEQRSGALRALDASGNRAQLTLKLPDGARFTERPQVAVSAGDLKLDESGIGVDWVNHGDTLVIPIQKSSTAPSTIKITGIKLDVDRTVPEGDLKMEVGGTAVTETGAIFTGNNNYIELVIASCATPAPTTVSRNAVFKIGKSSYTINGQDVPMDMAPYIKDGRTMIPLRFAANAVGVANDNIGWDAGTETVTLVKGDRIVQMQIGNSAIRINGVSISTDVAPEIKDGRTMLPIRALSTVLGATVQWNESDQTVTISTS